MKTNDKIDSNNKDKENNNESNIKLTKENKKNKKNYIPLTREELNEQKENNNGENGKVKPKIENKEENNDEGKKKMKKYRTEVIRVRKRKEIVNDTRGVKDLDKSKKKEMKREESLSNFSVEFSEVIQENGVLKKDDEDIKEKIEKSMLKQKMKNKKEG